LLLIKNSATMDIPKYSSYNDLYRYAKELVYFVKTHGLHQQYFISEETTQMYLTHLDNPKFDDAVQLCQNAIHGSVTMSATYFVPAITGTIDQLRTQRSATVPPNASQYRIMALCDGNEEFCLAPYGEEDFSEDLSNLIVNEEGESPFIRSFRPNQWGGRTPFGRGGGRAARGGRGTTTEATLRESVMRVIWIITTHRHATFFLNSAKHSRTWELTPMPQTRRSSISKGGTRTNKTAISFVPCRMQASSPTRMYVRTIL